MPAASQGKMNNLLVGGHDLDRGKPFVYYETIAGGMGAMSTKDGALGSSGVVFVPQVLLDSSLRWNDGWGAIFRPTTLSLSH